MMLTLKELIIENIEQNFPSMKKKEKSLLGHLALKKVFNGEYYRGNYYISSVALMDNKDTYLSLNQCELGSDNKRKSLYSLYNDYDNQASGYDYYDAPKIIKRLVEPDVYSRLTSFINIIDSSKDINTYIDKIVEAHKGDPDFLPTIKSFSYLFDNMDSLMSKEIKSLLNYKGVEDINSALCKNSFIFRDGFFGRTKEVDDETMLTINYKWKNNIDSRTQSLNKAKEQFSDISEYYHQYDKKLSTVIDFIKEQRPFLFKVPSISDISFTYFETKAISQGEAKQFRLESDLAILPEILASHKITKSSIYDIPLNKDDPYQYRDAALHYVLDKKNDISNSLNNKFYGLDFLNEHIVEANRNNSFYILARANNETVGFFSFRSAKEDSKSLFKNIDYVCIKDNYRGLGLAETFYDKAISILQENGNILVNSCYTRQGAEKLPRLKQKMRGKYPDFLMIDTELGTTAHLTSDEKDLLIKEHEFNKDFMNRIRYFEQEGFPINERADQVKSFYRESIQHIRENKEHFINRFISMYEYNEEKTQELLALLSEKKEAKLKP